MMSVRRVMCLAACIGVMIGPTTASPEAPQQDKAALNAKAPEFALPDLEGKQRSLSEFKGKTVILQWFNADCPFVVNVYRGGVVARTLEALKEMGDQYVFLAIDSTANKARSEVIDGDRKFLETHRVDIPVLIDYDGAVGHRYDARTTPHVFIIDGSGVLRYHGEFTDDPLGRKPDANNRVLSVLQQLAAGETVTPDYVRPWGCSVKYKK